MATDQTLAKISTRTGLTFRRIEPFLYLAPATILIVLIFLYPIADIVRTSLLQNNPNGIKTLGIVNYRLVFQDPVFFQALGNNGKLLLSVPILTILSLIVAILLFEHVRGWAIYRSIIFMPYILAIPVVGMTFVYLLGLNGIINTLLRIVGLGFLAQDWLGSITWVLPSLCVVIIFCEIGVGVVLFLARLMSLE